MSERKPIDWDRPIRMVGVHTKARLVGVLQYSNFERNRLIEHEYSSGNFGLEYVDDFGLGCGEIPRVENVPEKRVIWVNLYRHTHSQTFTSRSEADDAAHESRIACVRVEYEEGEGLGGDA